MRDDSAEILFESCVREAIMSSSGMCRDVHPSTVSVQHFLRRPRRRAAHPQGARTYDFAKALVTRHFRCISFLVKEQQVFNDSRGPKRPPRKKKGRFCSAARFLRSVAPLYNGQRAASDTLSWMGAFRRLCRVARVFLFATVV